MQASTGSVAASSDDEGTSAATESAPASSDTDAPLTSGAGMTGGSGGPEPWTEEVLPGPPFELIAFNGPNHPTLGSWGPGSAWGDIDGDERLDLITAGGDDPSHVFRNQGDGTFAIWEFDGALAELDRVVGLTVVDFDNDGWSDIHVLRDGENVLLLNDEGQGLIDVTELVGLGDGNLGVSSAWGDFDNDGWLDVYVSNAILHRDVLYHGSSDRTFTEVTELVPSPEDYQTFSASWLDFDDDGDLDLFIANDKQVGNRLWRNEGPGCKLWCFVEVGGQQGVAMAEWSMGTAVGDFDGDLDLDLAVTDLFDTDLLANRRTEGFERFTHVTVQAGLTELGVGWGNFFFDYDNDGWLDLYVAEGLYGEQWGNQLFHNLGDGTFEDVSEESGCNDPGQSFGVSYADFDEDGALDIAVANRHDGHFIYRGRNLWPDRHWLSIDLVGGGPVNRDAIGSRVWVTTQSGRTMMQEVKLGSSVASVNMKRLHFGLGLEHVDYVTIRWPDGLIEQVVPPVEDARWVHTYPAP